MTNKVLMVTEYILRELCVYVLTALHIFLTKHTMLPSTTLPSTEGYLR